MTFYNDPKIIKKAARLDRKGLTRKAIAAELGLGVKTIRKIFDGDFAQAERERLREVDAARASRWANDPNYQNYQRGYGQTEAHRSRMRDYMRAKRARATS